MYSPAQSATEMWLLSEYGALIDSATTAKVLGYKNSSALSKARSRGTLQIVMMQIPNRRGWWTTPLVLATYLHELPMSLHGSNPEQMLTNIRRTPVWPDS